MYKFFYHFTRLMVDYVSQEVPVEDIQGNFYSISQDITKADSIFSGRYTFANKYAAYDELDKIFLPLFQKAEYLIPDACQLVGHHGESCDDGKDLPEYKQELDAILTEYLNLLIPAFETHLDSVVEQIILHPEYWADYRIELNKISNNTTSCNKAEKSLRFWQDAIPDALLNDSILLLQFFYLIDKASFYIKSALLTNSKKTILTNN